MPYFNLYITKDQTKLLSAGKIFTITNNSIALNNGRFVIIELDYNQSTNLTRIKYFNELGIKEVKATGQLRFLV